MYRTTLAISWTAVALALGLPQAHAGDPSTSVSTPSRALSLASGEVISGSVTTAAASGKAVVMALALTGEVAIAVLRGTASTSETSVKLSAEAARSAGLAVGTVVDLMAETAGYALWSGGTLLAFLPNEDTKGLLRAGTAH